jgi:hypothetical protein
VPPALIHVADSGHQLDDHEVCEHPRMVPMPKVGNSRNLNRL